MAYLRPRPSRHVVPLGTRLAPGITFIRLIHTQHTGDPVAFDIVATAHQTDHFGIDVWQTCGGIWGGIWGGTWDNFLATWWALPSYVVCRSAAGSGSGAGATDD